MKKTLTLVLGLVVMLGMAWAVPAAGRDDPQTRVLTGRVADGAGNPLAGAVVYLTNTRTRAVKTYIAGREGDYRFPGLAPNTDYEVYAQFEGKKGDTKNVSQFDSRSQVVVNLKVDTK